MNLEVNFGEINEGLLGQAYLVAYKSGYNDGVGAKDFLPGFYDGSITELVIPYGVEKIGAYFLQQRTNLEKVTFPNSLLEIGLYAFLNCTALKGVMLPYNLKTIGSGAFMGCDSITTIEIPGKVEKIQTSVFSNCEKLVRISFARRWTDRLSISEVAFANCPALTTINVPWSEGEVAGAPWGATNATINYNSVAY